MLARFVAALAAASVLFFASPGLLSAAEPQISASAAQQIIGLKSISRSRSGAETKLDSRLHLAWLKSRGDTRLSAFPQLRIVQPDSRGRLELDVIATNVNSTKLVLAEIQRLGGEVKSFVYRYRSLRATVPLDQVLTLAGNTSVLKINLANQAYTHAAVPANKAPERAAKARRGAVNVSQGDIAHRAAEARGFFGARGQGVKICVLSDGIDSLATLQASGDLPAVDVLPGQNGSGSEGTAMLEIIHDLAPDATLGFATALSNEAQFAQNILDLRADGCDIIVDDIIYFAESPFQDGIVADAVNQVTAAGALYFSSAGNEGNLNDGSTGTWEGDFLPNGTPATLAGGGLAHDFTGAGSQSQLVTASSAATVLHWSDPFATTANDYDLYVLNGTLTTVFDSSTNVQDGSGGNDDAVEIAGGSFTGERIVVLQFAGANRMINVNNFRGSVETQTAGCTRGHSAAAAAFSVAAVDVSEAAGGAFMAGDVVEDFSCDGPRRIFFNTAGALLPGAPAGNFSATGGIVRQKPDIAAADGVATATPGFNPFFGTSAAAPHAAAIAGLLKSGAPALTPAQIRGFLTSTAIDIEAPGVDRDSGAGIVMAFQALQAAGVSPQAVLGIAAPGLNLVAGDADTNVEPNEDWGMNLVLNNVGGSPATAISAVLSSSTPGVRVVQPNSAYPNLAVAANAPNVTPYVFSVGAAVLCGTDIDFTLTVTLSGGTSPQVFNFSVPTGGAGTPTTISYSGAAVPIPDALDLSGTMPGAVVAASLPVAGIGPLLDVDLRIDGATCSATSGSTTVGLDHSFVNDLELTLAAPGGGTVLAIDQTDGSGNNFCQTLLDDESAGASIQSVVSAGAPFTGSFLPNAALSAFDGLNANGNWELRAQDFFSGDVGNIRNFSLILTPAVCDAPVQPPVITATKVISGGTLIPGGTVTYTIVLTNTGGVQPDNAGSAEFSDLLPATLTPGTATVSSGAISGAGANPLLFNGAILPGSPVTITIPATISPMATGMISNQGSVLFDADRNGSNESGVLTDDPAVAGAANPTVFTAGIGMLTITPAAVPFGNQVVGSTSAGSTVTLANTGSASLMVTTLNAPAAPFARSGGTCGAAAPFTIAAGANCTLIYTYAPTATVTSNQVLTVATDVPSSGSITLSGTGTQGNLTITPATVPFGNQTVGTTSAGSTVTLANTGTASLMVTTLTAPTAPFARSGGTCAASAPFSIAAGANCTLIYTYAPTATGFASFSVTVSADAPGNGTINLFGTGVQGNLTITPATASFGNQAVGTTSPGSTVTLANTGTASLMVITLTAPTAPFARSGGTCAAAAPITIAAGANCTLIYTYAPTAAVASNQTLTVTANAPGSGTIALLGTGIQGTLGITPTGIVFANQNVGTTSAPGTITLSNSGNAPLMVTALSSPTAPFARVGGSCTALPITIAVGANCTLTYSFTPTATGAANQTVTVTANAPGASSFTLAGTGTAGVPSASDALLDFLRQVAGTTSNRTLTLSNTGTGPLTVNSISAAIAPFALSGGSCGATPFVLQPGTSCTLVFSFNSTTEGLFQQTINISTDFGALAVQLRGAALISVQIPAGGLPGSLMLLLLLVGAAALQLRQRR